MAPVIWAMKKRLKQDLRIVHTGQHYDWEMSAQFFQELDIPKPDKFLGVGSGTQGQQLSRIIASTEVGLAEGPIELAVVEGDTNSALGVALAASKNSIPLAHVEAGCRSFDKTMPEEINRILIADCADLNLAPTENCLKNLQSEGIPDSRIILTGHPIVSLLHHLRNEVSHSDIMQRTNVKKRKYVLATTHRQENVDSPERLRSILKSLSNLETTVVLPIHPRTRKNARTFKLDKFLKKIKATVPLGYLDTLRLIRDAEAVITDSGGIQQESFLLGTPCLTIRKTTEWMETVSNGGNLLVRNPSGIGEAYARVRRDNDVMRENIQKGGLVFGNADSAERISYSVQEAAGLLTM